MRLSFCVLLGGFVAAAVVACTGPEREFADGAVNGSTCAKSAECASGICVDGVCCDRACAGQCEACNLQGAKGTCSLVTGTPQAPRAICPGDGECAGTCNGSSNACSFPTAKTVCGAACDGTCDGAGKCAGASGSACPGGFACDPNGTGCLTSCAGPKDCQPNFVCNASKCERVPETECLDGADNNGDGLADCQDPTCNAAVECVPGEPTGTLGVQRPDGVCPAGYPTKEVFHTGLTSGTCTGCTCQTQCSATVLLYTGLTCNTTAHQEPFTGPPTGKSSDVQCKNYTATAYKSGTVTVPMPSGCIGGGSATQPAPTWATDDTFCAAKTSATCKDAGKVCAAKRTVESLCVRVDPAASCPAAYAGGSNGIFFSGFTPGSCGSCASCTKSPTNMCKATLLTPQVNTAVNCTGGASLLDNTCGTLNQSSYASVALGFSQMGADNCTSNVSSTPAQPSGGQRICCQP